MNYCHLPADVCPFGAFPVLDANQDCVTYSQLLSQIAGMLLVPVGAPMPTDWQTPVGWAGVINNAGSGNVGKYIVGRGSFLPSGDTIVNLGNGRYRRPTEHIYKMLFTVLRMSSGNVEICRRFERGDRGFRVWLETISGRLIGGPCGMAPFFTNGYIPFAEENTARENLRFEADFILPQSPAFTAAGLVEDGNGNNVSAAWGSSASFVWGDPGANTIWGDPGVDQWGS